MNKYAGLRQTVTSLLICTCGLYMMTSGTIVRFLSPTIAMVFSLAMFLFYVMTVVETGRVVLQWWKQVEKDTHTDHHHHGRLAWWRYWLFVIPLFSILVGQHTVLGSELIHQKTQSTESRLPPASVASNNQAIPTVVVPPSVKNLLSAHRQVNTPIDSISQADFVWYYNEAPYLFVGKTYTMSGFVYHPSQSPGSFALVRYGIWCCVADASPDGILVDASAAASSLPSGQWVQVTGTVRQANIPDVSTCMPLNWYQSTERQPVLIATAIKKIQQPSQPYLYPRNS